MKINKISFISFCLISSVAYSSPSLDIVQNMDMQLQMTSTSGNIRFDREGHVLGNGFETPLDVENYGIVRFGSDSSSDEIVSLNYDSSVSLTTTGNCSCSLNLTDIYLDVANASNPSNVTMNNHLNYTPFLAGDLNIPECAIGCLYEGSLPIHFGSESRLLPIKINVLQASSVILTQGLDFGILQKGADFRGDVITMKCSGEVLSANGNIVSGNRVLGMFRVTPQKIGNAVMSVVANNPHLESGVSYYPIICDSNANEILAGDSSRVYYMSSLNSENFIYAGKITVSNSDISVGNYDMSLTINVDY